MARMIASALNFICNIPSHIFEGDTEASRQGVYRRTHAPKVYDEGSKGVWRPRTLRPQLALASKTPVLYALAWIIFLTYYAFYAAAQRSSSVTVQLNLPSWRRCTRKPTLP